MITIYHNPRCSKSRQTLSLLQEKTDDIQVIEYLKYPPTADELQIILSKLGFAPRDLLRTKETEYKDAGLSDFSMKDKEIIACMVKYPKLIERPIVINGNKAAIGRPPENVLEIL